MSVIVYAPAPGTIEYGYGGVEPPSERVFCETQIGNLTVLVKGSTYAEAMEKLGAIMDETSSDLLSRDDWPRCEECRGKAVEDRIANTRKIAHAKGCSKKPPPGPAIVETGNRA